MLNTGSKQHNDATQLTGSHSQLPDQRTDNMVRELVLACLLACLSVTTLTFQSHDLLP